MKKLLLIIMSSVMAVFIHGCRDISTTGSATQTETTTTAFANPDTDYCVAGRDDGVFVCTKTWSSYFDAPISLKVYMSVSDEFLLPDVYQEVEDTLREYHQLMDKYSPYDGVTNVYSINHRESDAVVLDSKLFAAIDYALQHEDVVVVADESLFNIALGPILSIWHEARESAQCEDSIAYSYCPVPVQQLTENTVSTDPSNIVLDEETLTISFLEPGMEIDLGGYGKGYVSEIICDTLDQSGIRYILNAGNSNVKAGGINPEREDGLFYIGLIQPTIEFTLEQTFYAYIKIPSGISVVTSGNYQRFFKGSDDNVVYHHIIDPRTNYPGGEAMSVTVFHADGALADIYSTAVYLLTIAEGVAFVDATAGLEAVWYKTDGTLVYSENFEANYLYLLP